MRNVKAFIVLSILFNFTCVANATLIYDANASSSFTLIDSGGLIVSALAEPELPSSMSSGTATASIDADFQSDATTFPTSGLMQSSDVSGSAGAPSGSSTATVLNGFLVILENEDDFAKTAVFEFTYDWDVSLIQGPVSDASREAGIASAFFHLSGFAPSGSETLAIDEGLGAGIVSVADWLFNPFISFEFDDLVTPGALSGSTSVTAYVTVPEFGLDSFSVITDATGSAIHVNEPIPVTILLFGFLFVLWRKIQY